MTQVTLESVRKKYTSGIYKITVAYMDHNLEIQSFETDGSDLKLILDDLTKTLEAVQEVIQTHPDMPKVFPGLRNAIVGMIDGALK